MTGPAPASGGVASQARIRSASSPVPRARILARATSRGQVSETASTRAAGRAARTAPTASGWPRCSTGTRPAASRPARWPRSTM